MPAVEWADTGDVDNEVKSDIVSGFLSGASSANVIQSSLIGFVTVNGRFELGIKAGRSASAPSFVLLDKPWKTTLSALSLNPFACVNSGKVRRCLP